MNTAVQDYMRARGIEQADDLIRVARYCAENDIFRWLRKYEKPIARCEEKDETDA